MSVPLAVTVNVPEFKVDDPAGDGAPMSCASQGAGTAANTLEAPQSAMSAMRHDTRMTSNRRQIGIWKRSLEGRRPRRRSYWRLVTRRKRKTAASERVRTISKAFSDDALDELSEKPVTGRRQDRQAK